VVAGDARRRDVDEPEPAAKRRTPERAEWPNAVAERVWKAMEALNPQGQMITADEVADLVVFLCGEGARSITGQGVVVASGHYTL
jgi:enoyl-[acyl-carrier-protein] reductase (NADH)